MCNGLVGCVGEWKVAADGASISEAATCICSAIGFMVSCHDNILQLMPFTDANSLHSSPTTTNEMINHKDMNKMI